MKVEIRIISEKGVSLLVARGDAFNGLAYDFSPFEGPREGDKMLKGFEFKPFIHVIPRETQPQSGEK